MARPTKSIDYLDIQITASAQQASQELERLTRNISDLGRTLSGVNVRPFINDLNQLGQSIRGINTTNLTRNMNRLTTSMSNYLRNTTRMASVNRTGLSAFNQFSRGANRLESVLQKVNNRINSLASRFHVANRASKSFAQTVGMLYAKFWLLIRGVKMLKSAVKSSMDYVEVLNYFEASFGQVAERGVSKWSEMGAESAQAYYDSFSERAKKVTADMSGFYPEKNGMLTSTNMTNLGMNPQQLMQYQSQFAQMASSMGTTSEQALHLSEVLTKLGADLASVKNMDFQDVWKDMSSGLVGMARTWDKYGANIRNANMQAKLHELGIEANVQKLSQADKALLRTIILLDASKYAWTDLSRTLNTPANQFRLLKNNIQMLGQTIGQLFLPLIAKVLPYINALVIALRRLFEWLAKILHIDLSGVLGGAGSQGADYSGISDLLDDTEDLGQALDDDTDSAKKFKKQLQGFDALNNLTSKDDDKTSGLDSALASGLLNDAFLDAIDDYLKAWKDAFDQLENKAKEIADKIVAFFKRLGKPIVEAWKKVGEKVKMQWYRAGQSLKLTFEHIARDFWKVWEQPETQKIFENIFETFGNIGEIVRHLSNKFREAWDANDNGLRILQAIRDIILKITDHIKSMSEKTIEWAKNLDLKPLFNKISEWLESLVPVVDKVMGVFEDFYDTVLLPLGKWVLEKGLPDLLQVFIDFNNDVDWDGLRSKLQKLWEHLEPFAERVGEGLIQFIDKIVDALADFINSDKFEHFLEKVEEWMDGVSAEDIAKAFEYLAKGIIALKVALVAFSAVKAVGEVAGAIGNIMAIFGAGGGGIVASEIAGTAGAIGGLSTALSTLATAIAGVIAVAGGWSVVDDTFFNGVEKITGQTDVIDRMREKYDGIKGFLEIWKDAGKIVSGQAFVKGGIDGITNSAMALSDAMDLASDGYVRSFEEMTEIMERFGGTEEDIETYRQHIIDLYEAGEKLHSSVGDWVEGAKSAQYGEEFSIFSKELDRAENVGVMVGNKFYKGLSETIKDTRNESVTSQFVDDKQLEAIGSRMKQYGKDAGIGYKEGASESLNDYSSMRSAWDNFKANNDLALEGVNLDMYEGGLKADESFGNGITDNAGFVNQEALKLGEGVVAEFHSIDEKTYNCGREYVVQTANGMASNESMITSRANSLTQKLSMVFENARNVMRSKGNNMMLGLLNGINSIVPSVISSVRSIANRITSAFSGVWKIHSPSLVMDEMGVNLMKGLQEGMESMYVPIDNSFNQFERSLTEVPEISDIASANVGKISANQTYNADNTETNALLRIQNGILQAILEKETGISSGDLFNSVMSSADSYFRQTGKKAFA